MPEALTQALAELQKRLAEDVYNAEVTIRGGAVWFEVYGDYGSIMIGNARVEAYDHGHDLAAALAAAITTALERAREESKR